MNFLQFYQHDGSLSLKFILQIFLIIIFYLIVMNLSFYSYNTIAGDVSIGTLSGSAPVEALQ